MIGVARWSYAEDELVNSRGEGIGERPLKICEPE